MPKTMRARVREDERTLELAERLAGAAGSEINVTLTGLPESDAGGRRPGATLPTRRLGPMKRPVTREEAYGDLE